MDKAHIQKFFYGQSKIAFFVEIGEHENKIYFNLIEK